MVTTRGQRDADEFESYGHVDARSGLWLLGPVETLAYQQALGRGLSHEAAIVAAQDRRYYAFVHRVSPMDYQTAANRPDMEVAVVIDRLVRAGHSPVDLYRPGAYDEPEDEEPTRARRPDPYNTVAPPWFADLTPDELLASGIVPPRKVTLRELKGIKTDGDPNRPSQRPGARWERRKRQLARQRAEAREGGV